MSKKLSHDQYVLSVRQQIAETAQAMLDGELIYLLVARKLVMLRHEAETDVADFMEFVSIDSETDDLPLGAVREFWDKSALVKLQPQIDEAAAWEKKHA